MNTQSTSRMVVTLTKAVAFTVATVLATIVLASVIDNGTSGAQREYTAVFTDATSLNEGDDVRMAGVKVGTVSEIDVTDGDLAQVRFSVAKTAPMTEGTRLELRFRNLIGQRYINVDASEAQGPHLAPGHTFDLDATKPALDLTLLFNGFQPLFKLLDPEDVNTLSSQIIQVFQGEGPTVEDLISSTGELATTLADRDQVIGELIDNLSVVMSTIRDRTDQLDTTIVTMRQLVEGLNQDRETIGSTIEGLGALTTSVSGLLEEGREPLRQSIHELGELSQNLSDAEPQLESFLKTAPTKFDRIGRIASYGSWLNTYVCSIHGRIPRPEGYYGDLGAKPIAQRCH